MSVQFKVITCSITACVNSFNQSSVLGGLVLKWLAAMVMSGRYFPSWQHMSQTSPSSALSHVASRATVPNVASDLMREEIQSNPLLTHKCALMSCFNSGQAADTLLHSTTKASDLYTDLSGKTFHTSTSSHVSLLTSSISFTKGCLEITSLIGVSRLLVLKKSTRGFRTWIITLAFDTSRMEFHGYRNGWGKNTKRCSVYSLDYWQVLFSPWFWR